jgi:hypothetical protein
MVIFDHIGKISYTKHTNSGRIRSSRVDLRYFTIGS